MTVDRRKTVIEVTAYDDPFQPEGDPIISCDLNGPSQSGRLPSTEDRFLPKLLLFAHAAWQRQHAFDRFRLENHGFIQRKKRPVGPHTTPDWLDEHAMYSSSVFVQSRHSHIDLRRH
jgi:hypothetical protein